MIRKESRSKIRAKNTTSFVIESMEQAKDLA